MILKLFLFLWSGVAYAAVNGVTFQYPTDNLTFNYLDTVNVTWTSNYANPRLLTFCKNITSGSILTGDLMFLSPLIRYNIGSQP
jgi:hypothetical protein